MEVKYFYKSNNKTKQCCYSLDNELNSNFWYYIVLNQLDLRPVSLTYGQCPWPLRNIRYENYSFHYKTVSLFCFFNSGRRDRMVVGFTTTYAISDHHHKGWEFKSCSWWGVLDTSLCDKVCQWLAAGRWFSPVSSTN